jgi:hypothetical protein
MENYTCHYDNCNGAVFFLKWQNQIFMQGDNGIWKSML